MMNSPPQKPPPDAALNILSRAITGRDASLFEADVLRHDEQLRKSAEGKRILVVGAAGSIGSSTVLELLRYLPSHVTLSDAAENNLVEVLRSIRACQATARLEVELLPIDFGSPLMERFLDDAPAFDLVLNFAAAKHVRSERDPVSILAMLDTNLIKADRFIGWLRRGRHGEGGVFFVSSDKAANPANLMGASKRLMEEMIFWHASHEASGRTLLDDHFDCGAPLSRVTSARFANVAFSDGSLPWGFLRRIARGQALSGPSDVKRFFLSLEESGQLCTLGALICPANHLLIPRLDPSADTRTFREIAEITLAHFGHVPRWCASEEEAREARPTVEGGWPAYFGSSDTMGEKLLEEFLAQGEIGLEVGLQALQAVPHQRTCDPRHLSVAFRALRAWIDGSDRDLKKSDIVELIQRAVPTLTLVTSPRSLDRKM